MARTFEEVASKELDALYQGALFLHAGDPGRAEALLIETLTDAAGDYPAAAADEGLRAWLEERLARSYLAGEAAVSGADRRRRDPTTRSSETQRLLEAAGRVSPLPRTALWLVLLRRWPYAAAGRALGVDRSRLDELLAYRDVLFAGVMGDRVGGTGTDGEARD